MGFYIEPMSWNDPALLAWLGLGSVVMFVLTILALPPIIALMPEDYFVRPRRPAAAIRPLNWLWLIGKNVLGWIIILVGLSMLVLPGQGLLTILVGVALINFPGKRQAECWLARRPRVLSTMNWIRKKAGRAPLQIPSQDKEDPPDHG